MTADPGGAAPLLRISDLTVRFGPVLAVDEVSLDVAPGPFGLGLVGESGSGKSTIGRAIVRLVPWTGGSITFADQDVGPLRGSALKAYRRDAQIVFQDPDNSLDPRMPVGATIAGTSCPADSASGSRSPGRSASGRGCLSWTSRPAPWTSAPRRTS